MMPLDLILASRRGKFSLMEQLGHSKMSWIYSNIIFGLQMLPNGVMLGTCKGKFSLLGQIGHSKLFSIHFSIILDCKWCQTEPIGGQQQGRFKRFYRRNGRSIAQWICNWCQHLGVSNRAQGGIRSGPQGRFVAIRAPSSNHAIRTLKETVPNFDSRSKSFLMHHFLYTTRLLIAPFKGQLLVTYEFGLDG